MHVFVTGENGIRTAQTIKASGDKDYKTDFPKKVKQCALRLDSDFDKLMRLNEKHAVE